MPGVTIKNDLVGDKTLKLDEICEASRQTVISQVSAMQSEVSRTSNRGSRSKFYMLKVSNLTLCRK